MLPNDLNLSTSSRASVALVGVLAAALLASPWVPWAAAAAILAGAGLTALNAGFYGFLLRARGPLFTLAAVPWHWVYYACAGIGFSIGAARRRWAGPRLLLPAQLRAKMCRRR